MQLRPTQILVLAAGALMLIAAFFNWVSIDREDVFGEGATVDIVCEQGTSEQCDLAKDEGFSAINTDFAAPLSTWPAIIGLVVAGAAALQIFAKKTLPSVLGFTPEQALFGLAVVAVVVMAGWLLQGVDDASWGIGFWLTLLSSIGLVAGTAMEMLQADRDGGATAPPAAPTAF